MGLGNDSLDLMTKGNKSKNTQVGLNQIKKPCKAKETINKIKSQATE